MEIKNYQLQASWTIDPFYIRCVKYWKGRKYVIFHATSYKKAIDRLSKSFCEEVDRQIIDQIMSLALGSSNE
jgi:hypothetical protein